jgi:hypothetical protein
VTQVADGMGITWGTVLGVALNQAMVTSPPLPPLNSYAVPMTSVGLSYSISNLPIQGIRLSIVDSSNTEYCAPLTAATGTVMWTDFYNKCYNGNSVSLPGPPQSAVKVIFTVTAKNSPDLV